MEDPEEQATLLDHTRVAVAVVDGASEYRYANVTAERLPGHPPGALVGRDALEGVHPADRERVRPAVETLAESDGARTESLEYRHRTAAGGWVRLEGRLSPATDDGRAGYVVAARDVTDRHRAEAGDREGEGPPSGDSRQRRGRPWAVLRRLG